MLTEAQRQALKKQHRQQNIIVAIMCGILGVIILGGVLASIPQKDSRAIFTSSYSKCEFLRRDNGYPIDCKCFADCMVETCNTKQDIASPVYYKPCTKLCWK